MSKKSGLLDVYIEGLIYCVFLIIGAYLCVYGNIYVKMIPITFIIGSIGQALFGKRGMTSFFSAILLVVLFQVKVPSNILNNLFMAFGLTLACILGEFFSFSIKLCFFNKEKKDKIKGKKICASICMVISLILGFLINAILNGDYLTYFKLKSNLSDYFILEYSSGSRFKIISAKYYLSDNPSYTFYTEDTLNNSQIGRFTIYIKDKSTIIDNYKEEEAQNIIDKINMDLTNIQIDENIKVSVTYDELDLITIEFNVDIANLENELIEYYAICMSNYLEDALKFDSFSNNIEQIRIDINVEENVNNSLATYIYMSEYKSMLEKNEEEPYEYIINALNVEYIDY